MNPLVVWINAERYYVVSSVGVVVFGVSRSEAEAALAAGSFDTSILDSPADPLVFKATLHQAFASELARLNDAVDSLDVDEVRQQQAALAERQDVLIAELAEERRVQGIRFAIEDLRHQLRLQRPFLEKVIPRGPYQEQDITIMLATSPMARRIAELEAQL